MHLGSHGYMRRSLHQGRFQLLWCFRPHHWPSQEEAPWMPPLAMANASLSMIYLLTSHRLRKNWRRNTAMAYMTWLEGRWIMNPPKQDRTEESDITSLARHNNLVEWVWTTFSVWLRRTTNTPISSNLKNSLPPYQKLSNTNSNYKTKHTILLMKTKIYFHVRYHFY